MIPARRERIDPKTGLPIGAADAAARVVEQPTRRRLLAYLLGHPSVTRQDITVGTGISSAALTRALPDLIELGYARTDDESAPPGEAQRFTADREAFLSDFDELHREFLPSVEAVNATIAK